MVKKLLLIILGSFLHFSFTTKIESTNIKSATCNKSCCKINECSSTYEYCSAGGCCGVCQASGQNTSAPPFPTLPKRDRANKSLIKKNYRKTNNNNHHFTQKINQKTYTNKFYNLYLIKKPMEMAL